jgi:RimJ/RimL family protein N-acetyltransferase
MHESVRIQGLKRHTVSYSEPEITWTIVRLSDQLLLGTCSLSKTNDSNVDCVLDFAIANLASSQSYLLECIRCVIDWVFLELRKTSISVTVVKSNRLAINVLSILKFQSEGFVMNVNKTNDESGKLILFSLNKKQN